MIPRADITSIPNSILCGDALEKLRELETGSMHACVTSPPYWNLRNYQHGDQLGRERTPEEYVTKLVNVFREVRRVLRDDGSFWLNIGDCYARNPKKGVKFEAKSDATYMKNHQATEKNTGAEIPPGLKPKDLCMIPARLALALQADGWFLRSESPWIKFNGSPSSVNDRLTVTHEYLFMFTKTANYFYDVGGARKPHKHKIQRRGPKSFDGTKGSQQEGLTRYDFVKRYDGVVVGNPAGRQRRTTDAWRESLDDHIAYLTRIRDEGGAIVDDDGEVGGVLCATAQSKTKHFAQFPPALISPLIRLSTSEHGVCSSCGFPYTRIVERTAMQVHPSERRKEAHAAGAGSGRTMTSGTMLAPATTTTTGWKKTCACPSKRVVPAIVLDPFSGAGTTGLVATRLGRRYVGIDINKDYCEMASKRIAEDVL